MLGELRGVIESPNMIRSSRVRDWVLLLICNLIWASQFVMVKIVQGQMGPLFATFFPMTLATLCLVPIVWLERRRRKNEPGVQWPWRRSVLEFALLGILAQAGTQLSITWGVGLSMASNAALIMLALPVSTALMAFLLLGERMSAVRWISFALAIIGVLECSGINWKELSFGNSNHLAGDLLIFYGVNGSAFYNVYSKKLLKVYSPLQVLLYTYYASFVVMLPATLAFEPQSFRDLPRFSAGVWAGLLMLAVFQYFLSMMIFLNVLSRLDATQAGLSNYLIPFFGLLIAAVVLGEHLTPVMIAGGLLVLVSTLLVTVYEERVRSRAASVDQPIG